MSVLKTERESRALNSTEQDSGLLSDQAARDRVAEASAKTEQEFDRMRRRDPEWDGFRNRVGK
jgi:hypothetical protein